METWLIPFGTLVITLGGFLWGALSLKTKAPNEAVVALAETVRTLRGELTETRAQMKRVATLSNQCSKDRRLLHRQVRDLGGEPIVELPAGNGS